MHYQGYRRENKWTWESEKAITGRLGKDSWHNEASLSIEMARKIAYGLEQSKWLASTSRRAQAYSQDRAADSPFNDKLLFLPNATIRDAKAQ